MALSKPVDQIVAETTNPMLVKHESWERICIGEIAEIDNGFAFKSKAFNKQGEGTPLIRIRDVTKGETETYYDGDYEDDYIVNPGDLLIGMDGDFNSARWSGRPALLNQRVCRIRLVSDLFDEGFLTYSIQPYLNEINKETSSVTVKHLSSKTVSEIPLPFPPLAEQRRIVNRIEELFSRLDAGVAALRHAKAQLQRYRQSVLAAAVTGQLTGSDTASWSNETVIDVCETVTDGDHQAPPKVSDGIPFLTIGNISSGRLDFSNTRFVPQDYFDEIKTHRIPTPNDVLYSVVGATIGIPVLVNTDRSFCFQRHIALLRSSDRILPRYLHLFMASPQTFRRAWEGTTGSAQPTLPLKALRALPISLPPVTEQHQIVAVVEARITAIDHLEAELDRQITRSNRLRQSTLASVFSGRL